MLAWVRSGEMKGLRTKADGRVVQMCYAMFDTADAGRYSNRPSKFYRIKTRCVAPLELFPLDSFCVSAGSRTCLIAVSLSVWFGLSTCTTICTS
jgi:hypothetical protein